jgi:hypothetical protein
MNHEPDLNRIAAFVEGRLAAAEREALLSHMAGCRACREVLALLAERQSMSPAAAWWQRPAVWLPVAATLVVASVSVLLVTGPAEVPVAPPPLPVTTPLAQPPPPGSETRPGASPPIGAPAAASPVAPVPNPSGSTDDLLRRRGGARLVGEKTFQLVAGEWIDQAYDSAALLPVVEAATEAARRDLLSRTPALEPYAALGNRVTVVHEGTVYRFAIP